MRFYNELQKYLDIENEYYNIVMGDWNSKIGESSTSIKCIGNFSLGETNDLGNRLIE